jgi:adenylate cyclase
VQWLERHTQTLFFALRGPVSPPPNIVILAIDDQSLSAAQRYKDDPDKQLIEKLMENWPWQRTAYAEVTERLMAAGAKSVSMDILFDLPSGYGEADDQRLQQTLKRYANQVTLAAAYLESPAPQGTTTELFEPTPALKTTSLSLGLVNFLPVEADGRVHRLGSEYQKQVLRPLKLQMIPSFAEVTLHSAQLSYPQPKGSNIFFYGPAGTFKSIPFWQVLDPNTWNVYKQQFKDKIVLIGTTTATIGDSDIHRTPFAEKMPGIEIHANAIATLLQGKAIAEAIPNSLLRGWLTLMGVVWVGVLLDVLPKRPVEQLLWGLGSAIAYAGISYLAFTYGYLILPTAIPVAAIALSGLSFFTVGAIRDQLEKFHLRNTLERYVAAPIVQEILKQPDDFHALLKGKKLKAAVLFSDIRGFTTLSYKLPPEQLIELLNLYFNSMVEAIVEAGGTVDKFIGDAVMAEFGFPVSQGEKQDALNAIRAALGMRKALAMLRSQFIQEGRTPFFNGIGINFGEVIAGDIGSFRRREYGVIGDTVNVASRVESITKKFGTDIIITESLYQLVEDEVEVLDLGEHPLKGREENLVRLYSLVCLKGDDETLYNQILRDLRQHLDQPELS